MSLTTAEAYDLVLRHFDGLFPRACSNCGRQFRSLEEYIQVTTPVGPTVSFDAELQDWGTTRPIGSLALANCPCGTTIGLGTETLAMEQRLALLAWLKAEMQERDVGPSVVLDGLRAAIRGALVARSAARR